MVTACTNLVEQGEEEEQLVKPGRK